MADNSNFYKPIINKAKVYSELISKKAEPDKVKPALLDLKETAKSIQKQLFITGELFSDVISVFVSGGPEALVSSLSNVAFDSTEKQASYAKEIRLRSFNLSEDEVQFGMSISNPYVIYSKTKSFIWNEFNQLSPLDLAAQQRLTSAIANALKEEAEEYWISENADWRKLTYEDLDFLDSRLIKKIKSFL